MHVNLPWNDRGLAPSITVQTWLPGGFEQTDSLPLKCWGSTAWRGLERRGPCGATRRGAGGRADLHEWAGFRDRRQTPLLLVTQHEQNETDNPPCAEGFSAHHSSTLSLRRTDDAFPATNCPQRPARLCTCREGDLLPFSRHLCWRRFRLCQAPGWKGCLIPSTPLLSPECPSAHSFPMDPPRVLSAGPAGHLSCAGSVSSARPRPLQALHECSVDVNTDGEFQGEQDP